MKRDMDLIREILIVIENHEHGFAPDKLKIDDYNDEQIGFHVLLMGDYGLLRVNDFTRMDSKSPFASPGRITWDGYEFLELSRNSQIWQKAKDIITQKGVGLPFDMIKALLTTLIKGTFDL